VIEQRSRSPLMPLSFFRHRTPAAANLIGFGLGTVVFGMFFLLSLYQQQVLGFSAMETGFGYLAVALTAVAASGLAQALVTKIQVKKVLAAGMALLTFGLLWFTQVSADGSYPVDLLPGFLLIGVGLGFSFVPVSIAALAGITNREAGLASGLINTSQQIGGAVGLAVLATVSTSRTEDLLGKGTPAPEALTIGFTAAFWVAAAIAAASFVVTLVALRSRDLTVQEGQAVPVPA
jgi:MFS family permease